MSDGSVVVAEGLGREFEAGGRTVAALSDVDLRPPAESSPSSTAARGRARRRF